MQIVYQHHLVFDIYRPKYFVGELYWNFADFMTAQGICLSECMYIYIYVCSTYYMYVVVDVCMYVWVWEYMYGVILNVWMHMYENVYVFRCVFYL